MWYPVTVAASASEPVSLDTVKAQCRVDGNDEDALLTTYISAARSHFETMCGLRFAPRTGVAMKCDTFDDMARLPEAPITSVTSIVYVDENSDNQTLSTSVYELRADDAEVSIVLKYNQVWPPIRLGSRITCTVALGYTTAPEAIQGAMLLTIAHWYQNREAVVIGESVTALPFAADALVSNHRRYA